MTHEFDAEVHVTVGGWLEGLVGAVAAIAAQAGTQALIQTSEGQATLDAFKKAAEMMLKARAGVSEAQTKVANVVALADQGDPAGKQGAALLKLANDLAKKQEVKATVGHERSINAELDVNVGVEVYDWGW